jgi:hypothetical protein
LDSQWLRPSSGSSFFEFKSHSSVIAKNGINNAIYKNYSKNYVY